MVDTKTKPATYHEELEIAIQRLISELRKARRQLRRADDTVERMEEIIEEMEREEEGK